MGRFKERFIELRDLEMEFLSFLEQLFIRLKYRVVSQNDGWIPRSGQPDLTVLPPRSDDPIAVELKLHRSDQVPIALLRNASDLLDRMVQEGAAARGLLIITQPVQKSDWDRAVTSDHELWDLEILAEQARQFPDLWNDFVELVRTTQVGTLWTPSIPSAISELANEMSDIPELGTGSRLANQLEASRAGRNERAAQHFEELCQQSLELIYGNDFAGWKKQASIEDGYQRLDLIARLVPERGSFWATLASDFRTRYVIFEFKNHSNPITQDEVYTTEKYLFTAAMRSVAIIIARKGDKESARRAMRGALREQGKLIICISMAELCSLLRRWDNGDDPTALLLQRIDEMLISIAR